MLKKLGYKINIVFVRRASNYIKDVSIEGGILTVILCCGVLFLAGSIYRVVNNARSNFEIFNLEQASLDELQAKNEQLKDELEYVTSDEYKRLFLRDTKGLSTSNEELYTVREVPKYLEEKKEYLNLKDKTEYSDWWVGLMR